MVLLESPWVYRSVVKCFRALSYIFNLFLQIAVHFLKIIPNNSVFNIHILHLFIIKLLHMKFNKHSMQNDFDTS